MKVVLITGIPEHDLASLVKDMMEGDLQLIRKDGDL
jgi:hypothetical protein